MKFRKDINGLRAFAVIGVLLFHFNASWMPGGFAGVDVFFVISGFLMTGIIFKGIEQQSFSILKFYMARANRIIPALALLCLVLLVLGWFYLTPLEYKALSKHAASSVGFVSNFKYWLEAGYFDAASHEKWLLHTWTLSVEWQFYIIYPLILVAMRKFMSIKIMKRTLLVLTILAFIFSVFSTYKWPNASYYLLSARAWEMMIGGLAYLYPFTLQDRRKKVLEYIGLALIVSSYFLISGTDPWPGYLALLPVAGTFLTIQAQRNNSIITGNIIAQKLGSWSYSIYLWHWPLVVILYTFGLPEYYIYLGIALSIAFGFLSYKYVERIKFRNDYSNLLSYFKSKPVYFAVFIGLMGSLIFVKSETITHLRFTPEQISIIAQQRTGLETSDCVKLDESVGCIYGEGPVKAILVGDSHAEAQQVAISERASQFGGSILSFARSDCPTIKAVNKLDGEEINSKCGELVANAIKISAEEYPDIPIIIVNRISAPLYGGNEDENSQAEKATIFVDKVFSTKSDEYRGNLAGHLFDTICEFSQSHPVYLTRPTPEVKKNVPITMFRNLTLRDSKDSIYITRDEYEKRHVTAFGIQDAAVNQCGAKILNPTPYFCDSEYCYGDIDGVPLYFDDDHLSSYGSEVISPIYDEVFKRN